jgi:hypothetical protein
MSSIVDLAKKAVMLTANVDALKDDLKGLAKVVKDLNDRVIRLEGSGDLVAEKARNAALQGAQAMNGELLKEVYGLKARLDVISKELPMLEAPSSDGRSAPSKAKSGRGSRPG